MAYNDSGERQKTKRKRNRQIDKRTDEQR